ncbi:ACS family hexuronate transporter-like MFS transporter [Pseudoduganella lurida]|uniref:ACS family hexuronate transporter-like MFS transporter n=1 Tax=Pseudoduganella lurida TaxID=1036180 RepID=A0A562RAR7_9BURK|nr:MFS transporter [Pseudoduganella lurida]TWI66167.1 ACS family hexuronate transporter-like MFS transporter [Pseudoduganella lurida]
MKLNEPVSQQGAGQRAVAPAGKYRWTICALLFFATTVNYLDRQVLSLLAPQLSKEFNWSNSDYANITAAFQFVYALAMIFAGPIVDKLGTKKAYMWAIAIWSGGAILHAYSVPMGNAVGSAMGALGMVAAPASIIGFIISRAVLAIGEAGNFPAAIKATAEFFPKKERAFATGIFNSGANVGAILAPLTVPVIAIYWGWQAAFIAIGVIGFVWMILWQIMFDTPEKKLSPEELAYVRSDAGSTVSSLPAGTKVSWFKLLTYRQTWAFAAGKFLTDGVWWFFLFWLPKYLASEYQMGPADIVLPLAVLYSMTMFGSIGGGYFPAYFMNRGYAPYDGRMRAMFVIALFPLVVLAAQPLGSISHWLPVILIGIGASAHQAWSANLFTTVSDMFPQRSVASIVGIGGMAGGIGGVVMSKLGGYLFDYYGALGKLSTGYTIMFTICAVAYLLAWFIMKALVPQHKEITDL